MHQEMSTAMKRLKKMGGLGKLAAMFSKGGLEGALGGLAPPGALPPGGLPGLGGGGGGLPGLGGSARSTCRQVSTSFQRNRRTYERKIRQWQLQFVCPAAAPRSGPITASSWPTAATPRDGRFIEKVGTYNPLLAKDLPERVKLDADRIQHWLGVGAQPSDRVLRFLDAAGIRERAGAQQSAKGASRARRRRSASRSALQRPPRRPKPPPRRQGRAKQEEAEAVVAEEVEAATAEPTAEAEAVADEVAEQTPPAAEEEPLLPAEEAPAEEAAAESPKHRRGRIS